MDALWLAVALLIPIALGSAWLNLLIPKNVPARHALVLGHGAVLGLVAIPVLMRLADSAGLPLNFALTAIAAIVLTGLALRLSKIPALQRTHTEIDPHGEAWGALPVQCRALIAALLLLLLWRIGSLGLELFWRPLFPWDATMHWATKARVWFEHEAIVPFVSSTEWLHSSGENVYTDRHPNYPATVPLLQVWMNLALGRWDESAMNLPWLICYVALGLSMYGQLRIAGVSKTLATVFSYLLLSMPLINIHVSLAGYADLFLGATYCVALMALHNWSRQRKPWLGLLMLLFAGLCYLLKNEGAIWPLTLIPAIAAAFLSRREAAKLFVLFCLFALLGWLIIPKDWVLAGVPLNQLQPMFNVGAAVGIITSVFVHDSWHLFGYMMIALVPLGLFMRGVLTRTFLPLTVALGCAVGLFLFLFLATGFGWGAANYTAVGRLSIHLAPGLTFLAALLYNELLQRKGLKLPAEDQPVHEKS